jgi:hypothetical protein
MKNSHQDFIQQTTFFKDPAEMHCIRFRAGQFFPGWRLENPVGKSDTTRPGHSQNCDSSDSGSRRYSANYLRSFHDSQNLSFYKINFIIFLEASFPIWHKICKTFPNSYF